jgi:hypothetical protein
MDIEPMFFDRRAVMDNRSTVERFNDKWLFYMPTNGIVIFKKLLFFNADFLSRYGDAILARLLTNMEIFVYAQTNTDNFQQILTIEDLKKFNENNNYTSYRYIVGKTLV